MPAANSVASELVKPPVVVISMLYQDIARLPLYQHRAIKPRHTQAPVRHNYERYLFCVDLGDYRIISWHGFFVYVILWLVFHQSVSSLSSRSRAAPADSATVRDDRAPPLATNQLPTFWKGRQRTFPIGRRQCQSMCRWGRPSVQGQDTCYGRMLSAAGAVNSSDEGAVEDN